MKFTNLDYLRCAIYTFVLGAMVIVFGHAEPRAEAVLVGLFAWLASLNVRVTLLQRELARLSAARSATAGESGR